MALSVAPRLTRNLRTVVLGLALSSSPRAARAEPEGRKAVVIVEGGAGQGLASLIEANITTPNAVSPPQPFSAALAARGTRALASAIGNRARNGQLVARVHSITGETHVDVVILVAHTKVRRTVRGHVWIIDAHAEGATVDQDLASTTVDDEADEVWTAAASLFAPAAAASPPPKDAAPREATQSTAPAAREATVASIPTESADNTPMLRPGGASENMARAQATFIVELSFGAGSRHVSYVDRITPTLRPYDLFATPLALIRAELYPLARTGVGPWLRGIGVTGRYGRALALTSADAGGTHVGTRWQAFDFGVRDRMDILQNVALGAGLAFGVIDFDFDQPSFAAALPSADYSFLRARIDARGSRGDLSVFGSGAYLAVLSTGAMHHLFPRERAGGVEAELGAAYAVSKSFELSLAITYTRFFFSMRPQPGDAYVAGGALDEMACLSLTLAYLR